MVDLVSEWRNIHFTNHDGLLICDVSFSLMTPKWVMSVKMGIISMIPFLENLSEANSFHLRFEELALAFFPWLIIFICSFPFCRIRNKWVFEIFFQYEKRVRYVLEDFISIIGWNGIKNTRMKKNQTHLTPLMLGAPTLCALNMVFMAWIWCCVTVMSSMAKGLDDMHVYPSHLIRVLLITKFVVG